MNLTNMILRITNTVKPFLIKMMPIEILRKWKSFVIYSSYKKVAKLNAEPFLREKYKDGINLFGNIRAEIGLGQSCRLVANQLSESKIKFTIYTHEPVGTIGMGDSTWMTRVSKELPYNINLIHMNPYELGLAYVEFSKKVWKNRYNIVFWLWELEELPPRWAECIPCIDEIWTPSEFVSNTMRKYTTKPVITIPYYVEAPADVSYDRNYFNLSEDLFLFLIMYDSNSTMERKNPLGAIEAFKTAFSAENKSVGIVIKINNACKDDIEKIKGVLIGYDNVYYITDILTKTKVNSLIRQADVFVSLHRAEGFGLVLAEAMILGTPTIATNWSANTEFMTKDTACLVDYTMVLIEQESGPYGKGYRWAEPDLKQAAYYMEKLWKDKEYYDSIALKAQTHVEKYLSREQAVSVMEKRVENIVEMKKKA